MDNRVSNSSVRISNNPSTQNQPRIPDRGVPNAFVNTTDTGSFSGRVPAGSDLGSLNATVQELESRVRSLEARVSVLAGPSAASANGAPGAIVNLPGSPVARSNNGAADSGPTNGGPMPNANYGPGNNGMAANNAVSNNYPANNLPAPPPPPPPPPAAPPAPPSNNQPLPPIANFPSNNFPANNAAANNAAANSAAANNAPTSNIAIVNNGMTGASARVPAAQTVDGLEGDVDSVRASLVELQTQVRQSLTEVDRLLRRTAQPVPATADAGALARRKESLEDRQAGLAAVEHVLRYVKPGTYTPEEEAVVQGAVKRVNEIGKRIAGGQDPSQFSAELFSLKHTIIDPAGAGTHKAVTSGAQTLGMIDQQKSQLKDQLRAIDKQEARGPLSPAAARQKDELTAKFKALTGIEQALDTAKLTKLSATGEKVASDAVNRLGDIAEGLGNNAIAPRDVEDEVYRLGQVLRNPNKAPDAKKVDAGADVLRAVADGKEKIHTRLREIDETIMGGAAAEPYNAERSRLLNRAEALDELAAVVKGAHLDAGSPAAQREVAAGLQKASEIAQAIAGGESPARHRAEVFVLKQTFQEPLPSKDNAAIQSAAATLQLIGRAEEKNAKDQEAIASGVNRGTDARKLDAKSTQLHRQAEDLEAMRHAIEQVDFGGLNSAQEAAGARLLDKMRDISVKVASGEDFGKLRPAFDDLATQLADLRHAPGVDPTPVTPAVTPEPAQGTTLYAVKKGDYLTKIAREQLGDADLWKEIVALNKDKYPSLAANPDLIYAGWMLQLPKGAEKPKAANNASDDDEPVSNNAPKVANNDAKANGPTADGRVELKPLPKRNKPLSVINNAAPKPQANDDDEPAPTPVKQAPVKQAQPKPAAAKPAPIKQAPIEPAPVKQAPVKQAPVETAKAKPAPAATPAAKPVAQTPKPAVGGTYTVKKGDSLTGIAQNVVGDIHRWRELVSLNEAKYPSLSSNPDLLQVGWKLDLPTGSKPKPKPPAPPAPPAPSNDKPTPIPPKPPVTPTPEPAKPVPTDDKAAVTWLRANLGDDQRISRAEIEKMPDGPGKKATLQYFDALMFGFIDPGKEGWENIYAGDVKRMEDAVAAGQSIPTLAKALTEQILTERKVGDITKDGRIDGDDLSAFAEELRSGKPFAPKPPVAPPAPVEPKPTDEAKARLDRMHRELDAYLSDPGNAKDASAVTHLLSESARHAEVATVDQKARLIQQVLSGSTGKDERNAALRLVQMAADRGELPAVIEKLNGRKDALKDLMHDLGNNDAGRELAKVFLAKGMYKNEAVWKAMDDDATVGLMKSMNFKQGMVGLNDDLLSLPEEARHHMIKELVSGNVRWEELYMARWINQHNEIPYRIPEFNNAG